MYRFLLTPRWLGILALTLVAAAVMVLLGNWQLDRYRERTAVNERIDAGTAGTPVPLRATLPAPTAGAGTVGPPPPSRPSGAGSPPAAGTTPRTSSWSGAGRWRARSASRCSSRWCSTTARRCWSTGVGCPRRPAARWPCRRCPALPTGQVTVIGRVHPTETGGNGVDRRDGRLETRRVTVDKLARELPYPLHGAYLLLDEQTPANDPAFRSVPIGHTNNWQNFGYVVQWWLFAAMTLFGYGWVARREARRAAGLDAPKPPGRPGGQPATPAA